tara:strand:+ start:8283 stop:8438 length:156 start_codon:yes stop_codon:yes gene_type:complete
MMNKVRHIKGKKKPRLCGAKGNYEPVGTDKKLRICKDCQLIHFVETGEMIE